MSRASDSSTKTKKSDEQTSEISGTLTSKLFHLKRQTQASRSSSIKEKLRRNKKSLQVHTSQLLELATSRKSLSFSQLSDPKNMLSYRIESPLCKLSGHAQGLGEKDNVTSQEVFFSLIVKLPHIEKIPTYTTWMFLDKNQRMAEDQSVVGRRQIYYDQCGGETLICSDSEEEIAEPEEEKHEFSEAEDQILRKVVQEHGVSQEALTILSQMIKATSSEIEDRCNILMEKHPKHVEGLRKILSERNIFMDKSLSAALDSFDNLFCRRCLVFDCRLHGCSQDLIIPSEKQVYLYGTEGNRKPCSGQCYLQGTKGIEDLPEKSDANTLCSKEINEKDLISSSLTSYPTTTANFGGPAIKKQKTLSGLDLVCMATEDQTAYAGSLDENKQKTKHAGNELIGYSGDSPLIRQSSTSVRRTKRTKTYEWEPIEKELYAKGVEIFGKNSCLIARNTLSGLKTCKEVYTYMFGDGDAMTQKSLMPNSCLEDNGKADADYTDQEVPARSRFIRRRGRARKLKYTWKSAGHPSIRKRIADGKHQSCKQYTPCGCKFMCGKQCPCHNNGTCCEKYCGCSKSCKNRFRGCHCAKSQCRSRQCPCFAAGRECDPDVCRNCWVSCGDGSLGEPPARGDGYQCGNMKLLLKQQQRILLSKSDVAGWGAFLRNPVNKNDYLGEYTGELISHREADKRGKIYDRANSSFLFDLNDQYVLDAYRKGDKLKFANHSSNPNCYAKVMLVAGDHRVGIFAKEHIEASEELFYDYRYCPAQAPVWARKPGSSKRDDSSASHGRAQKHQSY